MCAVVHLKFACTRASHPYSTHQKQQHSPPPTPLSPLTELSIGSLIRSKTGSILSIGCWKGPCKTPQEQVAVGEHAISAHTWIPSIFNTLKATALITTDALAPTHRYINWFSDPIEDGIDPFNWVLERALQDTTRASRCW